MKSQSLMRNLNEEPVNLKVEEKKVRKFHEKMDSLVVKLDLQKLNEEFNIIEKDEQ